MPPPRLADHFPTVSPGCEAVAAEFFHCFEINSIPANGVDATAGERAPALFGGDLGEEQASFEVRVHSGGGIVWQKKMSYTEILAKGLPKGEQDEAIGSAMEKALHTVQAAIARGKLS